MASGASVLVQILLQLGRVGLSQGERHEAGLALRGALADLVDLDKFCEPGVVEDLLEAGSLVSALLKEP